MLKLVRIETKLGVGFALRVPVPEEVKEVGVEDFDSLIIALFGARSLCTDGHGEQLVCYVSESLLALGAHPDDVIERAKNILLAISVRGARSANPTAEVVYAVPEFCSTKGDTDLGAGFANQTNPD